VSFWSSIFGGANPTLSTNIGNFGSIGGFATGMGEKNLSTASNFWNSILSGDATKQMQALAPEVSAAKTSAAQTNKTTAEMGTRSGGTAASTAATNDKVHADITNLIGSLTNSAATGLASTGGSLLSQGMSAFGTQAELSEEQLANLKDSILGKGIAGAVNYAEAFLPIPHGG